MAKHRKVELSSFQSKHSQATIYCRGNLPHKFDPKKKNLNIYIYHDFYDYHTRYLELGDYLISNLDENVSLFWMDFSGHGHSSGTRSYVGAFEHFCHDALEFLNINHNKHPHASLLFGQGMGALVILKLIDHILNFQDEERLDFLGMIYANPFVNFNDEFSFGRLPFEKKISAFTSRMKLPFGPSAYQLCTDPIKNREMQEDGLINTNLTWGMIREIFEAAKSVRRSSYYLNYPSLFLSSGDDFFTSEEKIYLFQKGLPKEMATYKSYTNAKHDIVNDVSREAVFSDIVNWIKIIHR